MKDERKYGHVKMAANTAAQSLKKITSSYNVRREWPKKSAHKIL